MPLEVAGPYAFGNAERLEIIEDRVVRPRRHRVDRAPIRARTARKRVFVPCELLPSAIESALSIRHRPRCFATIAKGGEPSAGTIVNSSGHFAPTETFARIRERVFDPDRVRASGAANARRSGQRLRPKAQTGARRRIFERRSLVAQQRIHRDECIERPSRCDGLGCEHDERSHARSPGARQIAISNGTAFPSTSASV